jgi:hypothetical protein
MYYFTCNFKPIAEHRHLCNSGYSATKKRDNDVVICDNNEQSMAEVVILAQ